MKNGKQFKSLASKSDSLIWYKIHYNQRGVKGLIQVPEDCELLIIFNLLGKIAFMNSTNWSDKSQRMLERKLSNILF